MLRELAIIMPVLMFIAGVDTPSLGQINNSTDPLIKAEELIKERQWDEARQMLSNFVSNVPPNWGPFHEESDRIEIAFWDEVEFRNYSYYLENNKSSLPLKKVIWVRPSYSKAYYLLARVFLGRKEPHQAMQAIDKGLSLEPDHPLLLSEKARIFQSWKKHDTALELFKRAETARAWALPLHIGQAMRGQASCLAELIRLDEAESILRKSLELDPGSSVENELAYIETLRRRLTPPIDLSITLERGGCHGTCPIYSITIQADGLVIYNGQRFVSVLDWQTSSVSHEQLQRLVAKIESAKFFALEKSSYPDARDIPCNIIAIVMSGKNKKIWHCGCGVTAPYELCDLEKLIDEVSNSKQWVGDGAVFKKKRKPREEKWKPPKRKPRRPSFPIFNVED